MKISRACLALLLATLVLSVPASAGQIEWVNWTDAAAGPLGSASGDMGGITVSYSGEVLFAQTGGGTNYWVPNTPYLSPTIDNAPPDSDIIALCGTTDNRCYGDPPFVVNTLTFSAPVTNPVMAVVSMGQPGGYFVSYDFDAPFTILSFGPGYWGGPGTLTELPGDVLEGHEGHGAIQFEGTFTSISWTVLSPTENWHGFTVGAPVPEPSTITLLGLGFAAAGWAVRRRRSR